MKHLTRHLAGLLLLAAANVAAAHSGHGEPGSVGHDLQHQLWMFSALVAVAVLLRLLQGRDGSTKDN
jgi:hypothetical protein